MNAVRLDLREDNFFHFVQPFTILAGQLDPPPMKHFRLAQLLKPDGGGDVGHVVFEARRDDLVVPRTFHGVTLPRVA